MQPVSPAPAVKPKGGPLLWAGGILLVGGIILAIVLIVLGFNSMSSTVDGYDRVSASEGGTIQIDDPGRYTVYLERPGIDEDTATFSGYSLPSVVVQGPTGVPQPLSMGIMEETYSFSGRDGRKLGTFQADRPGEYWLRVTGGGAGQLAVGADDATSGLLQLGAGLLLGGAAVVLGVILLIVGGVRRSNSRRTLLPLAAPSGWGAPPSPTGWGAPPGMGGWNGPPGPPAPPAQPGWAPPAQPGWAPPPAPVPPSPPGWAPPPAAPAPDPATPPPLPADRAAPTPPPLPSTPDDPTQTGPIS